MLGGVLLFTALVYLRSLGDGFVSDDDTLVLGNPYIGQWSFLWKSLFRGEYWFADRVRDLARYRPLLLAWTGLNYHLFGFNPVGWHATMVAVHLVAVWLVFKVAVRLTGDGRGALLAALLFGLLPVHAEVVSWVSGFGLVMSAAFALAAFYVFIGRAESRNWLAAMGLYALALLSHETAATLPALIGCYVFLLEQRATDESGPERMGARIRSALLCMLPFVLEVFLYLVVRARALGFVLTNPNIPVSNVTVAQVLMTVPRVFVEYLAVLAIPWMAGPSHRVLIVTSPASPHFYLSVAALLMLVGGSFVLLRNHPRRRLYLFCLAWMALALAPAMDLFAFLEDQIVHDGYAYLASAGGCVLVADWALNLGRAGALAKRVSPAHCQRPSLCL